MKKIFTLLSVFILTTLFSSCIILADGTFETEHYVKTTNYIKAGTISQSQINEIFDLKDERQYENNGSYYSVDISHQIYNAIISKTSPDTRYYTKSQLLEDINSYSGDYIGWDETIADYFFKSSGHYFYAFEIKQNGRFTNSFLFWMK